MSIIVNDPLTPRFSILRRDGPAAFCWSWAWPVPMIIAVDAPLLQPRAGGCYQSGPSIHTFYSYTDSNTQVAPAVGMSRVEPS